jgi:uncharacterized protein with PQ loop repeat
VNGIAQWFLHSPEYRALGYNLATFTFVGTSILSVMQGWSIVRQNSQIWAERTAANVEPLMFTYLFFYCLSFGSYGLDKGSVVATFNGMSGILYVPVLLGIVRFRNDIRFWHIATALLFGSAMVANMVMAGDKDSTLMIYLFGILFFIGKQAWKVWQSDDMGELNVEYVVVFLATAAFWLLYAFVTDSWPLKVFNTVAIFVFLAMLKPLIGRWRIFQS